MIYVTDGLLLELDRTVQKLADVPCHWLCLLNGFAIALPILEGPEELATRVRGTKLEREVAGSPLPTTNADENTVQVGALRDPETPRAPPEARSYRMTADLEPEWEGMKHVVQTSPSEG